MARVVALTGGTLLCVSMMFLVPSARQTRQNAAIAALEKNYAKQSPSEVAMLRKGHFIVAENNFHPFRSDEAGFIMIWAPVPGSTDAYNTLEQFLKQVQVSNYQKLAKKELLIAPHRNCPGWTLLGKLIMADRYERKSSRYINDLQAKLPPESIGAMPRLQALYDAFPKEVRDRVERDLDENRELLYKHQKTEILLQTGLGQYYSIHDSSLDRCVDIAGDSLPFRDPQK